jgi:ABC-2 type transport system permease protein
LLKKEIFHIFRDYRTLIILFGIPVMQILIFGFVVTNEIRDVRIAILDQSKDNHTRAIINKIMSSGYFILEKDLNSFKEIEPAFKSGKIKEVIVFQQNFGGCLEATGKAEINIIADASDANTGNMISNYTQGIIFNYVSELNKTFDFPYSIHVLPRMYFNQDLKAVYMFVPGTMALILILISALMTSITITREKEMGTMETLLVSPLRPIHIILG